MKDETEIKWIWGDEKKIVLKKSVEEVTYSVLVEHICGKINVYEYKNE